MAKLRVNVPLVDISQSPQRPDAKPLPSLRIHHLFAMTAVSADLLTSFGPGLGTMASSKILGRVWIAMAMFGTIYAFLLGFAITVTVFGIFWRLRGIHFPNHPGHWLFVTIAASYILSVLFGMFAVKATDSAPLMVWLSRIPGAVLDVYVGLTQCAERRWRWVFYFKVLATCVPFLGDLLLMVMLSRANLWDRRLGVRRDMLHRSGVAVQLAVCVLMIAMFIGVSASIAFRLW